MLPRATLRAGIWAGEIAARSRMCRNDALGEDTLGVKGARLNANRRSVQQAMPTGRHTIPLYAKCDILAWSRPRRIAKAVASGNFTGRSAQSDTTTLNEFAVTGPIRTPASPRGRLRR